MATSNPSPEAAAQRVSKECYALRVQLLNRVVTRLYDEALRPVGLTMNQMSILTVLANMGEAQPGVVGRFLQMEKSTISRNVKRMLEQKWLVEKPAADARRVTLALTEKGRGLIARALPHWEEAQAKARELLGDNGGVASLAGAATIANVVNSSILKRPS